LLLKPDPGSSASAVKRVLDVDGCQRRAMAGQRISFLRTIRNASQMYLKHLRYTDREVQMYRRRFEMLRDLLAFSTGKSVSGVRVLEVGCGQRAVLPLLFAANGAEASAVDVEIPTYQLGFLRFFEVLRRNGLHRAIKGLLRHTLFDRRFFSTLALQCGVNLDPFPALDVEVMDAAGAGLPGERFDMVFSFHVLEHVVDVEPAVRNMNSALKSDGIGFVVIHLFPSLSGGHCMDWQYALDPTCPQWGIPADVPPWDHLRDNSYPADSYLNRLRLTDYRRFFHKETEVVAEERTSEGVDLLSLAPRELLTEYSREDLTTAFVSFTFRKKQDADLRPPRPVPTKDQHCA